jgi:hypothetical protein
MSSDRMPTAAELAAMTPRELKSLTNRLRNAARRQRKTLHKSRRRDALAWDFQRWEVIDADTGEVLAAGSLVDV